MKLFTLSDLYQSRKGLIALGLLAALLAAGAGWKHRRETPRPTTPAPREVVVTTVRPQRENLWTVIEQPGQIEGFERTALYAKIAGYVRSYHFDIGDRVRKGDLLAELWVPEVVEDLHQRESTVTERAAEIVQAGEALRVAEAAVTRAAANLQQVEASRIRARATDAWWTSEYRRVSQLHLKGASAKEELEQARERHETAAAALAEAGASVEAAKAAVTESKAQRDKAAAGVRVAETRLTVARADQARAAVILGYARIEAPYDGVVSRRFVDTGAYVQAPAANTPAATPLFEVVRTDLVRIFVDTPEGDAAFVRDGGPARVRVQALGDREFQGRVARSSWLLDGQTRTLRTEVDLPNPGGRLRPGMYAYARIPVERPDSLTLPTSAVFQQDDRSWIVLVEGNTTVRTPVRLGARQGELVEVLSKQLRQSARDEPAPWEDFTGSETAVRDNPSALADGQVVRSRTDETTTAWR